LNKEQKSKEVKNTKKKYHYHIPALIAVFAILFLGIFVVGAYIGNNDSTGLFGLGTKPITTTLDSNTPLKTITNTDIIKSASNVNNNCNIPNGKFYTFTPGKMAYFLDGTIEYLSDATTINSASFRFWEYNLNDVAFDSNMKKEIKSLTINTNINFTIGSFSGSACVYKIDLNQSKVVLQISEFWQQSSIGTWFFDSYKSGVWSEIFNVTAVSDLNSTAPYANTLPCPYGYYLLNYEHLILDANHKLLFPASIYSYRIEKLNISTGNNLVHEQELIPFRVYSYQDTSYDLNPNMKYQSIHAFCKRFE